MLCYNENKGIIGVVDESCLCIYYENDNDDVVDVVGRDIFRYIPYLTYVMKKNDFNIILLYICFHNIGFCIYANAFVCYVL